MNADSLRSGWEYCMPYYYYWYIEDINAPIGHVLLHYFSDTF
jgi:hypothetical protein